MVVFTHEKYYLKKYMLYMYVYQLNISELWRIFSSPHPPKKKILNQNLILVFGLLFEQAAVTGYWTWILMPICFYSRKLNLKKNNDFQH